MCATSTPTGIEAYAGGAGSVGVLLCHGFTGSTHSLRPFADALVEAGLRVSLPLLPGHGTTWEDLNTRKWQEWYSEVETAYAELSRACDEIFVVGLSMGGALALRLAAHHPAIRGVVLVNPSLTTADHRFRVLPALARFAASFPGITNDIAKPDMNEQGYDRVPLRALVSLTRLWSTVENDLPNVRQPLIVFRSVTDHVVDPSSIDLLYRKAGSPDITERPLERSFHVATLDFEAEDIFAESLDFIRAHSRILPEAGPDTAAAQGSGT